MKKFLAIYFLMFAWTTISAQLCSGFLANITVTGGNFPGEISWQLMNGTTQLMAGEAPVTGQVCLPNLCQNYTLLMFDSFGDGWNGGSFSLSYGSWIVSTTLNSGASGSSLLYAGIAGCLDPFACNYNSSATCNSGCIYGFSGCTDPNACNFEPLACFDNGSCCYGNCVLFNMTDSFGDGWNGATFTIYNSLNEVVQTGTMNTGSSSSVSFCLPSGCYTFTTTGGSFPGEIGWSMTGQIQGGSLSGGAPTSVTFNTIDLQSGCTDAFACNYDPNADCENGSCYYGFTGCTDSNACNYNPLACTDDGSCQYGNLITLEIFDAILPGTFVLYDHTVALEYGSPNYTSINGVIEIDYQGLPYEVLTLCIPDGCYDFWLTQVVNPNMTYSVHGFDFDVNHYSWFVGLEGVSAGTSIAGCTHPEACNYKPLANCDDGTCTFEGNEHCMHLNISGIDGTGFTSDMSCMESISFIIRDLNNNVIETLHPATYPLSDLYYTLPDGCYTCQVVHGIFCNFSFSFSGQNGPAVVGNQLSTTFSFTVGNSSGCTDPTASNYEPSKCVNDGSCCYGTSGYVYLYDSPIDGWQGPFCNIYNGNNQLVYSAYLAYGEFDFLDKPCLPEGCYTYEVGTQLSLNHPENTFFQVGTTQEFDSGQMSSTGSFEVGLACGDPLACNYNPLMTCEVNTDCIYGFGGCTDPASCAYDELACIDDGSCDDFVTLVLDMGPGFNVMNPRHIFIYQNFAPYDYTYYTFSETSQYHQICLPVGCYTIEASLYSSEYFVLYGTNEGDITSSTYVYQNFSIGNNIIEGCTNPEASNYLSEANCENSGECCYGETLYFTMSPSSNTNPYGFHVYMNGELYETLEWTGVLNDHYECFPDGCATFVPFGTGGQTFDWVIVNSNAQVFSGVSTDGPIDLILLNEVGGCLDHAASNYTPNACYDDGSCCYGSIAEISFWNYANSGLPGSVEITNELGEVVYSQYLESGQNYVTEVVCLPIGCLTSHVYSESDDHTFSFWALTDVHNMEEWFNQSYAYFFQQSDPYTFPFGGGVGCTDPAADNYSPTAVCDNGTCIVSGCTDPTACNFNPAATNDNGTCELGNPLNFVFTGLNDPETATVHIYDALGIVEIYSQQVSASNTSISFCLYLPGCYTYHVVPGPGSTYSYTVTGMLEGIFGGNQSTGPIGISSDYAISDCADPTASNYYQHACSDNGFCCPSHNVILEIYPLNTSAGLENITTNVYDWDGNLVIQLESAMSTNHQFDYYGLCLEDGCYFYTSYSEEAFSEYAVRFTDHDRNYPDAPIEIMVAQGNMGVAEFMQIGTIVPGCANPSACNYNPMANCDDNTCSTSCVGDLDCSGIIGIGDLLIFASQFGCTVDCGVSDLNLDGLVNTTDLLIFISKFGTNCP